MEHAPIYRSTARRTATSFLPWQRTASLATAAVALTVSGIALGYNGFTSTAVTAASTGSKSASTQLDATSAGRSAGVPVPTIAVASADGGHPDVISTLSSALIAQFQAQVPPILALPIGPLVQPLMGPPQPLPTAEAVVLPAISLEPSADLTALPLDLSAPPMVEDAAPADDLAAAVATEVVLTPLVRTQAAALIVAPGEDVQTAADAAPAEPAAQEQVAAAVVAAAPEPAPAPAPSPAAHASQSAAPVHVAPPEPVVHKAPAVPARAIPAQEDEAPPVQPRRAAPPAEPAPAAHNNNSGNGSAAKANNNNQDDNAPARSSSAKNSVQSNKGTSNGNGNSNGNGGGSDHGG